MEPMQPRCEPLRGQGFHRCNPQICRYAWHRAIKGDIQLPEQVAHGVGQRLPLLREHHLAVVPLEERCAQIGLKVLDLMTDGRWRHEQFLCRCAETEVPGGGLEGSQGVERGGVASFHEHPGTVGPVIVSH